MKSILSRPWRAWAVYTVITGALYALAIHAPLRTPLVIEPTAFDSRVPMFPAAAYAYATYALLLPALIAFAVRRRGFAEVFATAMGCGLTNTLLYNFLPSRIANRSPAPEGSLLAFLQNLDTPLAAIPSGHVALPASIAVAALWISLRRSGAEEAIFWRRMSVLFGAWTLVLAVSTLLTRQHYALDVVTGLIFGSGIAGIAIWAHGRIHIPSGAGLVRDWAILAVSMAVAIRWWNLPVAALATIVIATRQHAILVLYHDGVHGLVARARRLNDFVVNGAIGVPLLLPLHLYRALHISHHHQLGKSADPERVLLYRGQPWNFRPLSTGALLRQLVGDLFAWNATIMTIRYFQENRRGGVMELPRTSWYPELAAQFALFYGAVAAAFVWWPTATLHAAVIWFLPYLTVTQLLQKIRSFAEHTTGDVDPSLACSWSPGILGRLTIWPYHINFHREHHIHPEIPWNRLPAEFPGVEQRAGNKLLSHLWKGAVP